MGEHKKHYYLLNFLGAILFILSLIITYYQVSNMFFGFSIIIISFGFSVATKLVVNQYMQVEQYNLINTLALNNIFKMMLIIIHFYLKVWDQQTYLDILTLSLQCYLLDFASLMVGCYLAEKQIKKCISTHIITAYFIFLVAISINLEVTLARYLVKGAIVLCVIATCVVRIRWKRISQEILHERLPFFRVLLTYMIMNDLVGYFYVWHVETYEAIMVTFQLAHVFYLFFCAFYVCISSPWEQRMHALNEAEEQIHEQSRNCDMIVNLSHELKTPVNVIRSALDIFMLDFEETEIIEGIKDIKKDCNVVMNIIQDMIDIQKINGHHIEIKHQTYNIVEIIENVMDAFSEEVSGSQLIFDPQEEEINGVVDGVLLQQCFMLLFGMLIQYDFNKKLFVEMSQEHEKACISIQVINANIPYLEGLYEQMNRLEVEDSEVANILTLKLICAILALHEGKIVFDKQHNEKELWIYLKRKEVGEVTWLDNRNVAVLNDQIRCRYIEV